MGETDLRHTRDTIHLRCTPLKYACGALFSKKRLS